MDVRSTQPAGTQTESSSLRGARGTALELYAFAAGQRLLEDVIEHEVSAIIGACLSDTVADCLQRSQEPPATKPLVKAAEPRTLRDPYAGLEEKLGWLDHRPGSAGPVRASWRPKDEGPARRGGPRRVDAARRQPKAR